MKKILRISIPITLACLFLGMLFYLAAAAHRTTAAPSTSTIDGTILVTTLQDELNNDGDCSLREAINAANSNAIVDDCPAGDAVITDTITFAVSGTIILYAQLDIIAGGPLEIVGDGDITISGGDSVQIINVNPDANLALESLTLVDGYDVQGGGIANSGTLFITNSTLSGNFTWNQGGGVFNESFGVLTIANCTLSNNSANSGGGIGNSGTLIVNNSTLTSNNAVNSGGGIHNWGTLTVNNSNLMGNNATGQYGYGGGIANDGAMTIIDSILSGNIADYSGGGIQSYYGPVTITNSTLADNNGGVYGGGILNDYGMMTIINSTLSGNSSSWGGGISNWETLTITNSTLSGNSVVYGDGGGIHNTGITRLASTIVANSLSGSDCLVEYGVIIDSGHNISSDDTCGFDPANGSMPNTDPLLGPLQDNGGPTWTYPLQWNSPAIDTGDDVKCPHTDQRGIPRPQDGDSDGTAVCDIGSYELVLPPTLVTISGTSEGVLGRVTYFTATVEPVSTTLPLEYVWQASGHPPITETRGLTDTVGWAWEMPGTQLITVTASNLAGSVVDTHLITITTPVYDLYLPLIYKNDDPPPGSNPAFALPSGGAIVLLVVFGMVGLWNKIG